MQVDIRSPNLVVGTGLHQHAQRCLSFAMNRFEPQIDRVVVTVADINGPRGGLDKRCGVRVIGRDGWQVTVMHTESRAEAAVRHAVTRAARAAARRIDRQRGAKRPRSPMLRSA